MRKRSKVALGLAGLAALAAVSVGLLADHLEADPVLAQLPTGSPAPTFSARAIDGRMINLADFRGRPVVLEWTNPECPSVRKHYDSGNMQKTQAAAAGSGAVWLTVNSGGEGKQGHLTLAEAREAAAADRSRRTAYILDAAGTLGKAYGATATPHMYIVSADGTLVYNGGIDDKPSTDVDDVAGARNHVLAALGELKAGKPVSVPSSRPYGCGVKYKG